MFNMMIYAVYDMNVKKSLCVSPSLSAAFRAAWKLCSSVGSTWHTPSTTSEAVALSAWRARRASAFAAWSASSKGLDKIYIYVYLYVI